jgi:twitching motility protein PilT
MKPIAELLRYLSHPAITEIALTTGRCPMIKSLNGYEPVDPAVLTDEELTRTLLTMVGPARAASVSEKPMKWSVRAEGVATLAVVAVRRGEGLSLRVMRTGDAAGASQRSPETTPTPGSSTNAAAIARIPETTPTPGSSANATAGQSPAVAPAASAPVRPHDTVPPAIAPVVPPVSRPAVAGLRVIKATGAQGQVSPPAPQAPPPPPSAALELADDPDDSPTRPSIARPDLWKDLPALLEEARRIGASDLHVVAGRPALFRVAGELKPQGGVLAPEKVEQLLLPQVPTRLRPVLEQEGSCDFALQSEAHGRFRVNVCQQRTGLKGSFRAIAREIPTLESLGLPAHLAQVTRHAQGLILVTGPAGHGKTSTVAALVDLLNRETKHHVLTVEDPVEHVHPRRQALLSQREVGTHTRSFASALEASLREDPDVLVVGELRDAELARLALAACERGCLLIGTMNTPGAAKTLERIIDLFPAGEQAQVRLTLASSLRLIVNQRLLPRADKAGLVAAAAVLPGSVALGHLIRDGKLSQLPSLQQRGKSLGILRLDDSLAGLVRTGKTTLEIARGFAESPDELEALVKVGSMPGRRSA